jgi:hypothetical protein
LSKVQTGKNGVPPQPGIPGNDGKGNKLTLEAYNNTMYGFLRLTVDAQSILCESLGVNETTGATTLVDSFTVDTVKHVVSTAGTALSGAKRKGTKVRPRNSRKVRE